MFVKQTAVNNAAHPRDVSFEFDPNPMAMRREDCDGKYAHIN